MHMKVSRLLCTLLGVLAGSLWVAGMHDVNALVFAITISVILLAINTIWEE